MMLELCKVLDDDDDDDQQLQLHSLNEENHHSAYVTII